MTDGPTFGRYAEIPLDRMTTEQREGYSFLVVAMALANERLVPQGLYDRAVSALGHVGITDVIVLMGYYTCVSLTMNCYAVPAGSPGLAR